MEHKRDCDRITTEEAKEAALTCSPAMIRALCWIVGQTKMGRVNLLNTIGIKLTTLRALESRGLIRFDPVPSSLCNWRVGSIVRTSPNIFNEDDNYFVVSWNVAAALAEVTA